MSNFIQSKEDQEQDPEQELTVSAPVEAYGSMPDKYTPGYFAARSFADFDKVESVAKMRDQLQKRVEQLNELLWKIWNDEEISFDAKTDEWETMFEEFIDVFRSESEIVNEREAQEAVSEFSESATGAAIQIIEVDLRENEDRAPLYMNVELIQPGPGNKRDNHYYLPEVLERDAKVFEGVKMYVTNHNENERSERTEVSQIEKIIGFSENGAPVARVAVFDPDFAEKTRNRSKMKKLDTLECSILASGTAKSGKIDGKKYKVVEAITQAHAVDWVTRAGAGGRAIELAENESSEVNMPENENVEQEDALEETQIHEQETEAETENDAQPETQEDEPAPGEDEQEQETEEVKENKPVYLAEAEISEHLGMTKLPVISRNRLLKQQYLSVESLNEAVKEELAYIAELTGAGKPNSGKAQIPEQKTKTPAEIRETQDAINKKWLNM